MTELTVRQLQILRAIVEEYIESAEPVGSDTIDKKFHIGVSPATIRNEMVELTKKGFLAKPHSSAGRSPTPMAMKLYVNELMREKELSVADEVSAKEKVWDSRDEFDHLMQSAAKALAQKTKALGLAMTHQRHLYHSGYANLLQMPEFYDINTTRHVLTLIEEAGLLDEIFESVTSQNPVHIVYGAELGNRHLEPVGLIFTKIDWQDRSARIAVLGSMRFSYDQVIPYIKYFRDLLYELGE